MERNDKAAIEALLKRHGFHFSKSMGQNFLIDPAIPYEIAESSRANEQNGVLEIGPGIGALSHELCERAGKVVAVELDKTLLPILEETMARFDNFEVVSADILKTDIPALVKEKFCTASCVVCCAALGRQGANRCTGKMAAIEFDSFLPKIVAECLINSNHMVYQFFE